MMREEEIRLLLDAISAPDEDKAMNYSSALFALVRVAREKKDTAFEDWIRLIARIFAPSVGALKESGMEANTFCVNPKTLTDSQVELLKTLVAHVDRPAAIARLADYVWLAKTDHKFARRAVEAYVKRLL